MKAWQVASRIGLQSTWGKVSFGLGAIVFWLARLRRINGPNFTWPLFQFSSVVPEQWLEGLGVIYGGRPVPRRTRHDLLPTIRADWRRSIEGARMGTPAPSFGRRLAMLRH